MFVDMQSIWYATSIVRIRICAVAIQQYFPTEAEDKAIDFSD